MVVLNTWVILFLILGGSSILICLFCSVIHIYRYVVDVRSRTFRLEAVIITSLVIFTEMIGFSSTVIIEEFVFPDKNEYNHIMKVIEWQYVETFNSLASLMGIFVAINAIISMLPSINIVPYPWLIALVSSRPLFYGLTLIFTLQPIITETISSGFVAISIYQTIASTSVFIFTAASAVFLITRYLLTKKNEPEKTVTSGNKRKSASKKALVRVNLAFFGLMIVGSTAVIDRLSNITTLGPLFDKGKFRRRNVSEGIRPRHFHTAIGFLVSTVFLNSEDTRKFLAQLVHKKEDNSSRHVTSVSSPKDAAGIGQEDK